MTDSKSASGKGAAAKAAAPEQGSRFVEKMFSGFGSATESRAGQPPPVAQEPYRALRQSKAAPGAVYALPSRRPGRVHADSPAVDVMTDLTRVDAVTIRPDASVEDANHAMIAHRVRSLFVVDDANAVAGIVTATDVLGERPIQVAQDHGMRHVEVLVRHVMTPSDLLEAMELRDVQQARVGDVVETLRRSGRQHALVIEAGPAEPPGAPRTLRGMFSLTQIARQLGLPPQVGHGVARTFAEIEAAIGR